MDANSRRWVNVLLLVLAILCFLLAVFGVKASVDLVPLVLAFFAASFIPS